MEQQASQSDLMQTSCRSQLPILSDISSLDLTPSSHSDDGLGSAYTTRLSYMKNSGKYDAQEPAGERDRSGRESMSSKVLAPRHNSFRDTEATGMSSASGGIDLRALDITGAQRGPEDSQRTALVGNGSASTSLVDALTPDFSGLSLGSVSSHTLDDTTPRPSLGTVGYSRDPIANGQQRPPGREEGRYGSAALNDLSVDPRLRQHLQQQQHQQQYQQQQAQQGTLPVPPPLHLSRSASGGGAYPQQPGSYGSHGSYSLGGEDRDHPFSRPASYRDSATPTYAQQSQLQGQLQGQGAYRPSPSPTPTHGQYLVDRERRTPQAATPLSQQQRYPSQSSFSSAGLPADDLAVSGLAARAMDSLNEAYRELPGEDGSYSADPRHAGYVIPPQVTVKQQQGYATATRYGDAAAAAAPPYPQHQHAQPPQRYPPPSQYPYQAPPPQHPVMHGAHYGGGSQAMGMPMAGGAPELIYQVQFKRSIRSFTLGPRANFAVHERDFVVVEADRGEDIGVVVEVLPMHVFMERRMNMPRAPGQQPQDAEDQNVCCILRLATLHERQQLPDKFHTEKDIVQSCNELATYGFGLPIVVFDAELQFDRRKLTIYYDCNVRIDFRDFVRQLYATYKARIWMKKVSPHVQPDVQPFAAMALATGVQFSQGAAGVPGAGTLSGGHY